MRIAFALVQSCPSEGFHGGRFGSVRLSSFSMLAALGLMLVNAISQASEGAAQKGTNSARLFPLTAVRLLDGPFAAGVTANRAYILSLDLDRLLAPFQREAGLTPRKPPYGNWESGGLDGHTAGHYLSALANMIASGADTDPKGGELRHRLDTMVDELDRCQKASKEGYLGGVPGSRELWRAVASGRIEALNSKWVPWYNLHKTFAGLRDAHLVAGNAKARGMLIALGDWCERVTSGLSDEQMQRMLATEHGGMNEALADIYAITGNPRYLRLARRFCHKAVLDPLMRHEDRLTGLHANTQIPKVIGLERIAALAGDAEADSGARFFWENVTAHRSVVFGGNSVSEHFNDPRNFGGMLEHREGPETCNTYNMLRLTEQLFAANPKAAYADFYERALFNHILPSINPTTPGYVYFTPIRPQHYRVYSKPEQCFWCCVGTGMENPGRYGQFIYARTGDGLYVNLLMASELSVADLGLVLRQETRFPDEHTTRLNLRLKAPSTFTLNIRHPGWVPAGSFSVRVNGGERVAVATTPSSYAGIRREWHNGDHVDIELPMHTVAERLPDGSDWVALVNGPIVLVSPAGTQDLVGLRAEGDRMGQVASGPLIPLDKTPVLLSDVDKVAAHVLPDPGAGPLNFRLMDIVEPAAGTKGLPLVPFFRLHDQRYSMYWLATSRAGLEARQERIAAAERAKAAREAATIDMVAIGEQQPEVEHAFSGEGSESGEHQGRRWRHGRAFQYTLNARGEKAADLVVTYWGGDQGRTFDVLANDTRLATEELTAAHPGVFFEKRYPIPASLLGAATDNGRVTVRFVAKVGLAGGIYDLRLMRPDAPGVKTD